MKSTLQIPSEAQHLWYRALYSAHRNPFVRWAQQQYKVEDAEARDAFPEAVILR